MHDLELCAVSRQGGRSHFAWETTIGDEKNSNIHIGGGMSEEDFATWAFKRLERFGWRWL